ncbi:MAG: PDZ domain-containing protein, partial [Vicinamibacterales bacterium]
ARPASGALATAAGRWPHADIIVPVFVMASTNERYRISGAESLPPGTPLFNGDGELFSVLGRRFAYPAREAFARLSARLAAGIGHASALDLGLQDRSADLARWFGDRGVIVARVGSSGSVAEAGMRPGDLILEINGSGVDSAEAARAAIAAIPAGQAVTLSGTAAAARGTRVPFERTVTSSSAFALRGGVTMPEGAAGAPRLGDLLAAGPVGAEDRGLPLQARVLQIDGVVPRTPAQASAALRRAMRGPRGALLYVDDGTERFFVGLPGVER